MISALFPGFLAAGALFATVPMVLHLLARRPPARRPLPTARFLREEQRTLLRLSHRPTDVPLLIVRMFFATTLGACFAGMTWASERTETARVVLVDVEAAEEIGMERLVAAARVAIADAEENGLTTLVVGYAAEESGSVVTSADLEQLAYAVGDAKASATSGLRVLRSALGSETALDSAEVVWIMQTTWHQWTPGVGLVREALWPGAAEIRATAERRATPEVTLNGVGVDTGLAAGSVVVSTTGFPAEAALHRALAVLGAESVEPEPGTAPGADWFFAANPTAEELGALLGRARAGATVVLSGVLPVSAEASALPWDPKAPMPAEAPTTGTPASSPGAILRDGRPPLAIHAASAEGAPATNARVIAVFANARPAVVARTVGDGCVVYTAISLQDEALTGTAGYVDLIDDLAHGCPSADGDLPLDRGAMTALARPDLPTRIALTDLDVPSGTPLTPVLLLLATALLGAEVLLTRRERA